MGKYASKIVELAQSWVGIKEGSQGHQMILDIYNSQKPLPRGYKMTIKDAWCAATVTAMAVELDYTDIIPCECSCNRMIAIAKEMGIWVEDESVAPAPGWLCLYDWGDNGKGDCKGDAEHIGIIEKVADGLITMIEGNYDGPDADKTDGVERRSPFSVNARYIRGYIAPKYDPEEEVEEESEKEAEDCDCLELRVLKNGCTGRDVRALQILLIGNGFSCGGYGADGDFGNATEDAVRRFQKSKGAIVDGIVGPDTWSRLLGIK